MDKYANELVFRVADKCFDGQLPNDADRVVSILIATLFKDIEPELLHFVQPELLDAVNRYLAMQNLQFPL